MVVRNEKLWTTPLYPFRIACESNDGDEIALKELWVDVTQSAPTFDAPQKTLSGVLDSTLATVGRQSPAILDFGAGKLRNTLYLLEKGYNVTAVEFEKTRESPQAKAMLERSKAFGARFRNYIFPHQFLATTGRFDLVLLVNVITIMPIPPERMMVLSLCHDRLRDGGFLLWYTQHGDEDQLARCRTENRLGDGYYIGENRLYKTFYTEMSSAEIDDLLLLCGFDFFTSLRAGNNQARLYRRRKECVIKRVMSISRLEKARMLDTVIEPPKQASPRIRAVTSAGIDDPNSCEVKPELPGLSQTELLQELLRHIKPGQPDAYVYEIVAGLIASTVFCGELVNRRLQEEIDEGRRRVDFIMTNRASSGIFGHLVSQHQLKVPYVIFEAKNYHEDLGNNEFDQLCGRLKKPVGQLGFILCRKKMDPKAILDRQCDAYRDEKLVLVLDDQDLQTLLAIAASGDENEKFTFLDEKIKEVVFNK